MKRLRRAFKYRVNDAGRSKRMSEEIADCSVRATAIAFKWSYAHAHYFMRAAGREDKQPIKTKKLTEAIRPFTDHIFNYGYNKDSDTGALTIVELAYTLNTMCIKGRYLVKVTGHIFAVIDGIRYDTYADLKCSRNDDLVTDIWRVNRA